ncbi:MAG: hypothetical protein ABSH16_04780 [Sedimentisphaerales bacterium]
MITAQHHKVNDKLKVSFDTFETAGGRKATPTTMAVYVMAAPVSVWQRKKCFLLMPCVFST